MHRNKPRKVRYSKSIVVQNNPVHTKNDDDDDDNNRGHADLSRNPSTSSMTVLISSSSQLTSQVGQVRNVSPKIFDISPQTSVTEDNVFFIDTFPSSNSTEEEEEEEGGHVLERSSVLQNESALEIQSLSMTSSSCSSSRNSSVDHSSVLEVEGSSLHDLPYSADDRPIIPIVGIRAARDGGLLSSSRTNSIDMAEVVCPPSWMSPTDVSNDCVWRPMKPGYKMHANSMSDITITPPGAEGTGSSGSAVVIRRQTIEVERVSEKLDASLKNAIPIMPRTLAFVCFGMNVISPGSGTFLSAVSVTCCSRPQQRGTTRSSLIWLNTWVALLQFITTPLFLLGWFWSFIWGLTFIKLSYKFSRQNEQYDDNVHNMSSTNRIFHVSSRDTTLSTTSTTRTTTTTTTLSIPDVGTRSDGGAIIVLHEAPIIVQASTISIGDDDLFPRRPNRFQPDHHRRRSIVRFSDDTLGGRGVPSWSSISYPQLLLAPGALESIVMNNGTYVSTTNNTGRNVYRGSRSARRQARHAIEGNRTTSLGSNNTASPQDVREGSTSRTYDSSPSKGGRYMGTIQSASHR